MKIRDAAVTISMVNLESIGYTQVLVCFLTNGPKCLYLLLLLHLLLLNSDFRQELGVSDLTMFFISCFLV